MISTVFTVLPRKSACRIFEVVDSGSRYPGLDPGLPGMTCDTLVRYCGRLLSVLVQPLTHGFEGFATFSDRAPHCLDGAAEVVGVGGVKRLERIDLSKVNQIIHQHRVV